MCKFEMPSRWAVLIAVTLGWCASVVIAASMLVFYGASLETARHVVTMTDGGMCMLVLLLVFMPREKTPYELAAQRAGKRCAEWTYNKLFRRKSAGITRC